MVGRCKNQRHTATLARHRLPLRFLIDTPRNERNQSFVARKYGERTYAEYNARIKWQWHISGEHYRNELTAGNYKNTILLDTKVIYKLDKRIELSATLNNILNQRTYNYLIYNQLTSFESKRHLRGRELLITISLRK